MILKTLMSYDQEADVLYVNFTPYEKPLEATSTKVVGDFLIRFRLDEVIGITVLDTKQLRKMLKV